MQIGHSKAQLAEKNFGLAFAQTALLREVVEQLSATAEFCDDPDGGFGRYDFIHLCNVRMMQLAVMVYFASQVGRHPFRDLLDGDPGRGQTVCTKPNLPIRS